MQAPVSECMPLLKYRRSEVNCNRYSIGAPAFLIISQQSFLAIGSYAKKCNYSVHQVSENLENFIFSELVGALKISLDKITNICF